MLLNIFGLSPWRRIGIAGTAQCNQSHGARVPGFNNTSRLCDPVAMNFLHVAAKRGTVTGVIDKTASQAATGVSNFQYGQCHIYRAAFCASVGCKQSLALSPGYTRRFS